MVLTVRLAEAASPMQGESTLYGTVGLMALSHVPSRI